QDTAISDYDGVHGQITIQGNKIGTDIDGSHAIPNYGGVRLAGPALIGGTADGAGNLISGNIGQAISTHDPIAGSGQVTIQGNYIGTDATGSIAIGNGITTFAPAISVLGTTTIIGGNDSAARNVISGNGDYAISAPQGAHIEG